MVEIRKFEVEFVRRTMEILENYNGEYSFSNLLNCTLGLIILPYENISSTDIWESNLNDIKSLPNFNLIKFSPVKKIKKKKIEYYKPTLEVFLKKIRNGLAHQNLLPINSEGNFSGIRIFNKFIDEVDLEVIFSENQLKEFCLYISNLYLSENNV